MAFASGLYNLYRYGSTSAPSSFRFPVGEGLSGSQRQQAGNVLGMQTPNMTYAPPGTFSSRPIGPNPIPARSTTVRSRTGTITPPAPRQSTPRPGTPAQTQSLTGTQRAPGVSVDLEELRQIEEMYGGTANFLSQLQQNIQGDLSRTLGAVGGQYEAQRPFLEQARGEALGQVGAQREAEQRQSQNAMSEARLLASELGQATRQRYGGTSSTGEFAHAIQGRELQRGQSRIQQQSAANLQTLNDKANSIQQNYSNQLQQLEAQKAAALNDVQNQFNQRIAQIDASRTENESAKAAAKLDALREARTRAEAIEDQKTQFQQGIESQTLAAAQNIYAAIQAYRAEAGEPTDLQALPGAEFSTLLGNQGTPDQALPQGYFKRPDTSEPFNPTGLFAEGLPAL